MRVLVTGSSGLLGGRLAEILARLADVVCARHRAPVPPGLPEVALDLLRPASVAGALDEARPDAIVHAGAVADADVCERDPSAAFAVNVEASIALARRARASSIRLVLLSTDLVLPGDRAFSDETVPTHPTLTYARSKRDAEEGVLAERGLVARVALVAGRGFGGRRTASEALADALAGGRKLRLFTDQYRTPVDPDSVGDALFRMLSSAVEGRFHLGGTERVSRYDLGLRVARIHGLDPAPIEAVSQAATPIGATRPADCSLDTGRARRELGWTPRSLDEAIRDGRPPIVGG